MEERNDINELVVSSVFFLFTPKPWGFMIQFDERAYVSNGLVKNQQRDNELLVAILSIILSGVTLILIGSGSEIFRKKNGPTNTRYTPKFNRSPLKNDGCKTTFLWEGKCSEANC